MVLVYVFRELPHETPIVNSFLHKVARDGALYQTFPIVFCNIESSSISEPHKATWLERFQKLFMTELHDPVTETMIVKNI